MIEVKWGSSLFCHYDLYKVGPVFAWLTSCKGALSPAHQWTHCRDIVGRYLQGFVLRDGKGWVDTDYEYGGIEWKPEESDPVTDPLLIATRLGPGEIEDALTFEGQLDTLLWPIEDRMGLARTEAILTNQVPGDKGQSWVIQSDPFWAKAPPLLNCYLLLVRATPYSTPVGALKKNLAEVFRRGGAEHRAAREKVGLVAGYQPIINYIVKNGPGAWSASQVDYYERGLYNDYGLDYFNNLSEVNRRTYMESGN